MTHNLVAPHPKVYIECNIAVQNIGSLDLKSLSCLPVQFLAYLCDKEVGFQCALERVYIQCRGSLAKN